MKAANGKPTALARLIMAAQETTGLSRIGLAQALEVTPVSVSKWLRQEGDCPVPWKHYADLAYALRIPPTQVLKAARQDHPDHVLMFERFVQSLQRVRLTGQSRRR